MEALKRLEEAIDPYAPYILITIFLWFLGGWLYETLSRAANSPSWKAKSDAGDVARAEGELIGEKERKGPLSPATRKFPGFPKETSPSEGLGSTIPTGRRVRYG